MRHATTDTKLVHPIGYIEPLIFTDLEHAVRSAVAVLIYWEHSHSTRDYPAELRMTQEESMMCAFTADDNMRWSQLLLLATKLMCGEVKVEAKSHHTGQSSAVVFGHICSHCHNSSPSGISSSQYSPMPRHHDDRDG